MAGWHSAVVFQYLLLSVVKEWLCSTLFDKQFDVHRTRSSRHESILLPCNIPEGLPRFPFTLPHLCSRGCPCSGVVQKQTSVLALTRSLQVSPSGRWLAVGESADLEDFAVPNPNPNSITANCQDQRPSQQPPQAIGTLRSSIGAPQQTALPCLMPWQMRTARERPVLNVQS
jgi:hypothetical protein